MKAKTKSNMSKAADEKMLNIPLLTLEVQPADAPFPSMH